MILKESEIGDDDITQPILGKPYKEPGKLFTVTGSAFYFIRKCCDLDRNPLSLKRADMRGIFQRYEKGLLLYLNKSNYRNAILIDYNSISKISVINNVQLNEHHYEIPRPFLFAINIIPLKTIVNFIVKLLKSQLIKETLVLLETNQYSFTLYTSHSSFNEQVKYFTALELGDKLEVIYPKK